MGSPCIRRPSSVTRCICRPPAPPRSSWADGPGPCGRGVGNAPWSAGPRTAGLPERHGPSTAPGDDRLRPLWMRCWERAGHAGTGCAGPVRRQDVEAAPGEPRGVHCKFDGGPPRSPAPAGADSAAVASNLTESLLKRLRRKVRSQQSGASGGMCAPVSTADNEPSDSTREKRRPCADPLPRPSRRPR
jgi:hypothetical protein